MEICVTTCWLLMLQTMKQWRAIRRPSRGSWLGKAGTSGRLAARDDTETGICLHIPCASKSRMFRRVISHGLIGVLDGDIRLLVREETGGKSDQLAVVARSTTPTTLAMKCRKEGRRQGPWHGMRQAILSWRTRQPRHHLIISHTSRFPQRHKASHVEQSVISIFN